MTFAASGYRPCHACGQLVRMQALKCRFCGETLPQGRALPALVAQAAGTLDHAATLERQGRFPHGRTRPHAGILQRRTWRQLFIAALSVGGIALIAKFASVAVDPFWIFVLFGLVLVFMFFALPRLVAYLACDIHFWFRGWGTDPGAVLKRFFLALRCQRPEYALACVLPGDNYLWTRRERPAGGEAGPVSFDQRPGRSLGQFCQEWAKYQRLADEALPHLWVSRTYFELADERNAMATIQVLKVETKADFSCLGCFTLFVLPIAIFVKFPVGLACSLVFFLAVCTYVRRNTREILISKWMHRVGERWYLVNGDCEAPDDMLVKLYHDCMERLYSAELPPAEVLERAALSAGEEQSA